MPANFFSIQPSVLRGDSVTKEPIRFDQSMFSVVSTCDLQFPKSGLCMVTKGSPKPYKHAVEVLAVYFAREMGTDWRPFSAAEYSSRIYPNPEERASDAKTRSFLWYDDEEGYSGYWPTYGGCTFRRRQDIWFLSWIWIHPYKRRKGKLSKYWPFFRSMFGVFFPEPPCSESMKRYLKKIQYIAELDKVVQQGRQ